jgi:glycosyltransferase involved in cell wall biosynthesis
VETEYGEKVKRMQTKGSLPEVEVLLATYNGDRFLREQIDSLLQQDYAQVRVLARDDGSSDTTVNILNEYAKRFPERFTVLQEGKATGHPKLNFLCLMQSSTAEYLCFSDQDDVWLPDKVGVSMAAMKKLEEAHGRTSPLLVFTDLRVVDARLQLVHPSFWKRGDLNAKNIHRLARVLSENVVTGCTAMINRQMCELAMQLPDETPMHDRWIGLLAASLGAAAAIPQQTVLYRQHESNAVGSREAERSVTQRVGKIRSADNRLRERLKSEAQVEALLRLHAERLESRAKSLLEAYLRSGRSKSRSTRVGIALRNGFYRSGFAKSIATIVDLWRYRSSD